MFGDLIASKPDRLSTFQRVNLSISGLLTVAEQRGVEIHRSIVLEGFQRGFRRVLS